MLQHEYMSYMEKKTSKRQTTIISLSDQNQKEIQDIREEKKAMLDKYDETKQGKVHVNQNENGENMQAKWEETIQFKSI